MRLESSRNQRLGNKREAPGTPATNIENPRVGGSIAPQATTYRFVAVRRSPKALSNQRLGAFFVVQDPSQARDGTLDRTALADWLADKGFGRAPLAEMQKVVDAENSDLFDVLAYAAFAAAPVTRAERAAAAKSATAAEFTDKQQAFVDFVLAQYVKQGVDELDLEKLAPLLQLKYRARRLHGAGQA